MTTEDPQAGRLPTLQLRASQFVKRIGALGGRKLAASNFAGRARSSSADVHRKPFMSPSQPSLSLTARDPGSDRSSNESVNRSQDTSHKRNLSMPLWNDQFTTTAVSRFPPFLHSSPALPGIVVTQHLEGTESEHTHDFARNGAAFDADMRAPRLPLPIPTSDPTPRSSPTQTQVPPTSPPLPPQHNPSTGSSSSDFDNTNGQRPGVESPPSPLLRPWTPAASGDATFNLGAIPSGLISPMALSSPIATPPRTSSTSLPAPFDLSIKSRRSPTPRLASLPPLTLSSSRASPLTRHELFDKEGHLLRLSPAIIHRAPPWPIKNLPVLPTPAPNDTRPPTAPRVAALQETAPCRSSLVPSSSARRPSPSRLSSMPALPMSGSVRPQVHDHTGLTLSRDAEQGASGDSPEHELAHELDDDEMEEIEHRDYFTPQPRPATDNLAEGERTLTAEPEPLNHLRNVDVDHTPFRVDWNADTDAQSFHTARTSGSPGVASGSEAPRPESGYFSLEPHPGTQRTPRPGDFTARVETPRSVRRRPTPLTEGKGRNVQVQGHHASHSMIDLLMSPPLSAPPPAQNSKDKANKRMSIARRQSLPSLTALPPVYTPREDAEEGHEQLPPYSNDVFLVGQMPRKVEFTQPGVLSKDRKWRRVWCVLEGTKFSIYRVRGVKSVWEGVVGAGDGAVRGAGTKGKGKERTEDDGRVRKVEEETRTVREEEIRSSFTRERSPTPGPSTSTSPTAATFLAPPSGSGSPPLSRHPSRSSAQSIRSSNVSTRSGVESTRSGHSIPLRSRLGGSGSSSSSIASVFKSEHEGPDTSLLLREYTMQHAESGLGSDYHKRQNVIRVRMEGEQFLLQAKDVEDVVEWIEGFQAASDIALDLDERKMPRGPLFPRRRRRRRPRVFEGDGDAAAPGVAATDTS